MPVPQAVVFDLGKVLLDFDYGKAAAQIARCGKLSAPEVRKFIDQSPLLFRYETGLMTKNDFYSQVCGATGFTGSLADFSHVFGDIFEPIIPMIEFHGALLKRKVPTFIFSNTNELAVHHIKTMYPFFSEFDGYVYSYEHGAMKPQAKLYQVVESVTGKSRDEILYLDDRAENIAAGAERGWQVILHETAEKTVAGVKESGLLG
jgi:FMN phosphatase YigB (HAD superfamily)